MIIRKLFRIPAKVFIEKDNTGNIIAKTITPDVDYDVDPILGVTTEETVWINDVQYLDTMIEFDENDLQYFLDKGWIEI